MWTWPKSLLPPSPSSSLLLSWHSSLMGWALRVRPVSNNVSNSVTPPEDPWQHLHALRYCPYCLVSLSAVLPALYPPSIPQRSNIVGADALFCHICWDVTTEITTDQLFFSNGFMPFHKLPICYLSMIHDIYRDESVCGRQRTADRSSIFKLFQWLELCSYNAMNILFRLMPRLSA